MSSLTLYKWRVWCVTENAYQYWWLDENQDAPTTCPNDSGHTITASFTKIVDIRDKNTVSVSQETTTTGGHYQFISKSFDALANTTTSYIISFPLDVSILQAEFIQSEENKGDIWTWVVAENTTIGAITSNVSPSDTVINVSSTVIEYTKLGYYINLYDGVNTDVLNRVIAIDSQNNTITVETAATNSFAAATPTYVRQNIYFCKDMEFGHPWALEYGSSKIKSSFLPANTPIKVYYTNNSVSVDKRIVVYVEILY